MNEKQSLKICYINLKLLKNIYPTKFINFNLYKKKLCCKTNFTPNGYRKKISN